MADRPKGTTYPKQQLEIVKYEADVPYGNQGKTLDRMNAKNLSLGEGDPLIGKALRYTIFIGELKTFLRGQGEGARFLCDVEERERPDSEYGPDRTVVQVYQDGKPVSTKTGGGGGGYRGRNLEDDLVLEGVKRRSIEGQTAIAQVGTVLTSPTPVPGEDLGIDEEGWTRILGKYWTAVEKGLDNYLADPPITQAKKPTDDKPLKRDQGPQDRQQAADKDAAVSKDALPVTGSEPVKHVGDLLTRATKLDPPVTRSDFLEVLAINDPKEITDLEGAWKKALELSASRRAKLSEGKGKDEKVAAESSVETDRLFE